MPIELILPIQPTSCVLNPQSFARLPLQMKAFQHPLHQIAIQAQLYQAVCASKFLLPCPLEVLLTQVSLHIILHV